MTDITNSKAWEGFHSGEWRHLVTVRYFIQKNYTPYTGDDTFLVGASEKTKKVWEKAHALIVEEIKKGVIDIDTTTVSGIDNFEPGYIDKENEVIVGLQTDAPLKRIVNPFGGLRTAKSALEQYGYKMDPVVEKHFKLYRKTHNDGVFDAYPTRIRSARSAGLLTGLPDAYGRGRIVGDYRRVPLYGTDFLIEAKKKDLEALDGPMTDERIRLREEVTAVISQSPPRRRARRFRLCISLILPVQRKTTARRPASEELRPSLIFTLSATCREAFSTRSALRS